MLYDGLLVCCEYILLPLVNEEVVLTYGKTVYILHGIPSSNIGEENLSLVSMVQLLKKQDVTKLKSNPQHGHMGINRKWLF